MKPDWHPPKMRWEEPLTDDDRQVISCQSRNRSFMDSFAGGLLLLISIILLFVLPLCFPVGIIFGWF
jgi:hypothetical protein